MNKRDANPDYKKIYCIVRDLFNKTSHFRHGPYDETFYTMRVYETAKEIIKKLNKKCEINVILTAALLHDIGKIRLKSISLGVKRVKKKWKEEWRKHPKYSVPIARRILKNLGHSEEFIQKVCFLVENHDRSTEKMPEKSLELQILQDADIIADEGIAAFIRPFLYCGKFAHQSIIGSIQYMQRTPNRCEDEGRLNLKISKKIAAKKTKIKNRLVKEISKEINSELLD